MNMAALNWIDFTVFGIVGFSILISLVRGFVREAISLATWILAIWVAYKYGHDFGQSTLTMVASEQAKYWIGAAILFFGVLILGAVVGFIVGRFVFFTGLSFIDRILGMAFGFARGVLLVAVLILVAEVTAFDKNTAWPTSQTIPQFAPLTEWLKSFVPEQFDKLKQQHEQDAQHPPASSAAPTTPSAPTTEPEKSSLGTVLPEAAEIIKQGVSDGVNKLQGTSPPAVNPAPAAPAQGTGQSN